MSHQDIEQLISLTLPTYNRADFLDYWLETHLPFVAVRNIAIYISDNASTDHTKKIVEKWQDEYEFLYLHVNEENVGMDRNFEISLNLPSTKYVWLCGDTYKISNELLSDVIKTLSSDIDYDAIICNLANDSRSLINIETKDYIGRNDLLCDLAGLMSCVACLIYSKDIINSALFSRYYDTYFALEAVIFEYISDKKFLIRWNQDNPIKALKHPTKKKRNWSVGNDMLKISVEGWIKFIYSLPPSYSLESKFKVQKSFGVISEILTYKGLLARRSEGALSLTKLITYRKTFVLSTSWLKYSFSLVLCIIPIFLMKASKNLLRLKLN